MIEKPTLLIDEAKAVTNIDRMVDKAARSGARLRPHFKTHQSAEIGEWFRVRGVEAITVSSVDMASYFADAGWHDITIAFPANPRQLPAINALAGRIQLNLLLESPETARLFADGLDSSVRVWLKVDAGYHRTGIPWDATERILTVAKIVTDAENLKLQGILTHAGNTYAARGKWDVMAVYDQMLSRMLNVQDRLRDAGLSAAISIGDTPSCSLADSFFGVDEIRPGNFVFYDLMQMRIGACAFDDIAVAVACPVVAKHPDRGQLIIYGGAVHLSKERLEFPDGPSSFGGIALPTGEGWSPMVEDASVVSLSQEHGIVQADQHLIQATEIGDVLIVIPVHCCLTVNLFRNYMTLEGQAIELAQIV